MPDPYEPALDDFAFTTEESDAIAAALQTANPWAWNSTDEATSQALASAKSKILQVHLDRHGGTCCYCRTNLHGAGPFMTDREHILPKGMAAYKPYSFTLWNLAASCKRCNLQFKRSGDGFVVDSDTAVLQASGNYLFIHPNFDRYEDHLVRLSLQFGTATIVKFLSQGETAKARYTRAFFDLRGLEVDSCDAAQGLDLASEASEFANIAKKLVEDFGQ